jgi:NADPH2:quinone reductase
MKYGARSTHTPVRGPEVLAVEPVEVTAPGPGEVRIRHKAIGLNFVEVYFRRGTFPAPAFPAILGNEAAGVVEAVGRDVRGVAIGDRVAYADGAARLVHHGATLSGRSCGPHPRFDQRRAGCGFVSTRGNGAFTIEGSRQASAYDTVLFHAAAGDVGLLFAQWARSLGIRVIGTVSDESKAAVARTAGCFEVINYSKENFVERVHTITNGAGVAAVYDAVGRDTFLDSLRTLRPRGTLVMFGKASGDPPPLDPFLLAPKSLYVTWPIRPVYTEHRAQLEAAAADLFDAIQRGILDVGPSRTYGLDDIVTAHHDLEGRRITGAGIIIP